MSGVPDSRAVSCPHCATTLVDAPGELPWCPACEWGLDHLTPREFASKRRARSEARERRAAFAINRRLAERFGDRRPTRPGHSSVTLVLSVTSALLFLVDIALAAGGVALLVIGGFALRVAGVFMVLLGVELRPRLARARRRTPDLRRDDAPELFELVAAVCDRLGAPGVASIGVDDDFNASCGRYGLFRRPRLVIGLPLWAALSPQGRLALLGHEIGHLVNGDPNRGLLTQPAVATFGRLAAVFYPRRWVGRSSSMGLDWLINPVILLVATPIHVGFRRLHLALNRFAALEHQQAEVYADALGVEIGGSAGACELMTVLVLAEAAELAVTRSARKAIAEPGEWHAAVRTALDGPLSDLDRRAQLTLRRQASLLASHPPSGLRHRLVRQWPEHRSEMDGVAERMAVADRALAPHYRRVQATLAARA
jgi:heat shock protein HtpX